MKKVREDSPYLVEGQKLLLERIDFIDTFSTSNHFNSLGEIVHLIFNNQPKWVKILFKIRNNLVRFLKINTAKPKGYNNQFKVGGYIGLFKIYEILQNCLVLGLNDSHLNFRLIVYDTGMKDYNIKVTTIVQYKNTKGRLYMRAIRPFHRLVVMEMMKKAYRGR